jgi:hypothetical protein
MVDEKTVWDEIWPVVEQLITATLAEDPQTMQRHLLPGEQAAEALDLFGFPVFDILLKTVLGRERLGLTRAIEADEGFVFIEYAWPDPDDGERRYTAVDVVTVRLGPAAGGWRVADINPANADLPLNALRAAMILAGSRDLLENGVPSEPWILPLTLYAGVLQLPIRPEGAADEVEQLLLPGLQKRQYGLLSLIRGRKLWRDFRAAVDPNLERPEAWAAAVETILGEQTTREQTQAAVGRDYRASLGAVSSRSKQIKAALGITGLDERYSELQTMQIVYKESDS